MIRLHRGLALISLGLTLLVAGCGDLPRGAAIQSEVLRGIGDPEADFVVYAVTRDTVHAISTWPNDTGHHDYSWPSQGGARAAVISPGDVIDLTIWDSNDTSLLVGPGQRAVIMAGLTVSPSGSVFIPYVNNIRIAGQTPDAARATIQNRIASVSPSAQVQLNLTVGQGNSVDLVGGVGRPGSYPMQGGDMTVLSLIATGGGVSPALRNPRVGLIRGGNRYGIGYNHLTARPALNLRLRDGDKVFIEDDYRFFQALGAAGREELVYFDRDKITAREAIAMVGGLSEQRADPQGVLILRAYPPAAVGRSPHKDRVIFTIDLTTADGLFSADEFMISPGDLVLVTESPVNSAQTVFDLIGASFGLIRGANAL